MDKYLKLLLTLVMMLLPFLIKAQDCAETYEQAVEIRRTRTIEAQQKAITLFEEARACFTTQADIDKCDRQIDLCVRLIRRMGGEPVLTPMQPRQLPTETEQQTQPAVEEVAETAAPTDVPTAIINIQLHAKDNEPIVITLEDLNGLEISELPEWISITTDAETNTLSIKVDNNSVKSPRGHTINVNTPSLNYTITIDQAPKKGLL